MTFYRIFPADHIKVYQEACIRRIRGKNTKSFAMKPMRRPKFYGIFLQYTIHIASLLGNRGF